MLKELNRVIELIESQILDDIEVERLARESGMSAYHLKRLKAFQERSSLGLTLHPVKRSVMGVRNPIHHSNF